MARAPLRFTISRVIPLSLFLLKQSLGKLINITIDDTFGDERTKNLPLYLPDGQWTPFDGSDCAEGTCWARPDPSRVYNQTWHDSFWSSSDPAGTADDRQIVLQFVGNAIYVYSILDQTIGNDVSATSLGFIMDNQPLSQRFEYNPTTTQADQYIYNALVYSNTTLPHGPHNLTILNGGGSSSILLFDYAVYSFDDSSNTQQTPSPAAGGLSRSAIAGICVVSILPALALFFYLFRYAHRRWRKVEVSRPPSKLQDTLTPSRFLTPFALPPFSQDEASISDLHAKSKGGTSSHGRFTSIVTVDTNLIGGVTRDPIFQSPSSSYSRAQTVTETVLDIRPSGSTDSHTRLQEEMRELRQEVAMLRTDTFDQRQSRMSQTWSAPPAYHDVLDIS